MKRILSIILSLTLLVGSLSLTSAALADGPSMTTMQYCSGDTTPLNTAQSFVVFSDGSYLYVPDGAKYTVGGQEHIISTVDDVVTYATLYSEKKNKPIATVYGGSAWNQVMPDFTPPTSGSTKITKGQVPTHTYFNIGNDGTGTNQFLFEGNGSLYLVDGKSSNEATQRMNAAGKDLGHTNPDVWMYVQKVDSTTVYSGDPVERNNNRYGHKLADGLYEFAVELPTGEHVVVKAGSYADAKAQYSKGKFIVSDNWTTNVPPEPKNDDGKTKYYGKSLGGNGLYEFRVWNPKTGRFDAYYAASYAELLAQNPDLADDYMLRADQWTGVLHDMWPDYGAPMTTLEKDKMNKFGDSYIYLSADGKTEVTVPSSVVSTITSGKTGVSADNAMNDFLTTYKQWKKSGTVTAKSGQIDASYWLALYEYTQADTTLSDSQKKTLLSNLDTSMQNGFTSTDKLTLTQKAKVNSLREQFQAESDHPEKYIFSLSGDPSYNSKKKEYTLTYTTVVNGQTVVKVITVPIDNIAGLTEKNKDTVAGREILAAFIDRYGKVLNLEESTLGFGSNIAGTNTKITAKELVQMYKDGELQAEDLANDTLRSYLITSYTNKYVDATTKNSIYDMLFAGSDTEVVYLNNDQYLIRGSKNPVTSSEAASLLVKDYLTAKTIGNTSLDALNQIWSLGLYDDLSDDARAAYNKRMSELVDGNTYKRPDGTTWVRPGSGYTAIPIDIFTNSVISGMSISKLKAWKTDGTYDNLTDAQKLAVDSRIKAIEVREAEATTAGLMAGVAKVVQGGIAAVKSFVTNPIGTIKSALTTAADLLKSYTKTIATAKTGTNKVQTTEKTFKLDLGDGFKTVTATSYQSALEKVKAIGQSVGEAGVKKEEANFVSEAKSYVKALADAAAKAAQAAANVVSTTGKVTTGSSTGSSTSTSTGTSTGSSSTGSSSKPKTTTNIIATAVAAVATVVTAVVAGVKAIGSILSGGGLGSNKLTTK